MTWEICRLVFRLETPLHVGRRGWGIIQRTRPYLMGKNLWAATTARLTRWLDREDYEAVGNALKQVSVFTYCYPAVDPEEPFLPHYREKIGLCYGDLTAVEFEYCFIGSYASTAIDPVAQAAEDASLHEVEVLLPHARDGGKQVYLCGYVLLHEEAAVLGHPINSDALFACLDDVQVGGERGYGYGRLSLQRAYSGPVDSPLFGRYRFEETNDAKPTLIVPYQNPLPAHTLLDGLQAAGDIEPLTGREWGIPESQRQGGEKREEEKREGAGQRLVQPGEIKVCYAPGSVPLIEPGSEETFALLPEQYGVMQQVC